MIRNDILIYTAIFWLFAVLAITVAAAPIDVDPTRGCIASAHQAEMRGFDLQENLDACK